MRLSGQLWPGRVRFSVSDPPLIHTRARTYTHKYVLTQASLSKFEFDGALNPKFSTGPFALELVALETY